LYGLVNVSGLAALYVLKHQAIGGVDDFQGLPCQGGLGFVGDEIEKHAHILMRNDFLKITHGTSHDFCSPMKKARQGGPFKGADGFSRGTS
jgi:hypothetical protein